MEVIDFPERNRGAVAMFSEMLHRAEGGELFKSVVIGMHEDGNTFIASSELSYLELMGLLSIAIVHGE